MISLFHLQAFTHQPGLAILPYDYHLEREKKFWDKRGQAAISSPQNAVIFIGRSVLIPPPSRFKNELKKYYISQLNVISLIILSNEVSNDLLCSCSLSVIRSLSIIVNYLHRM